MNQPVSEPLPPVRKNPWPRVFVTLGLVALLLGCGVFMAVQILHVPASFVEKAGHFIEQSGGQLRSVAGAFQQGTVRTEFVSRAVEIEGTTRLQVATLKQGEVFKREETGSTAWGLVPLPRIVVEAQAPVEYTFFAELNPPWEFQREGDTVLVYPPALEPGTPALDVSALDFYTLEGSIWRDEHAAKEKLRQSLSGELKVRAQENVKLVRELARERIGRFIATWLVERYSDGQKYHVRIVFPDERTAPVDVKKL